MEATIDAPTETAAAEAAAALAAQEAAGGEMTEAEKRAYYDEINGARTHEHDEPDPEPDPEPEPESPGASETSLPEAADAGSQSDPGEILIAGDIEQLAFRGFDKGIGGKKPTSSKLRFVGGAFSVEGGLTKGATYTAEVQFRVGGVSHDDVVDGKTQQAVDCVRTQKGRILAAVLVDAKTTERFDELHAAVQGFLKGDVPEAELARLVGVDLAQ